MNNFDSTTGSAGQVRFFNPGPVWVRPQVLQALTGPMLSHRSQAFMDLYGRILDKLPKVFRTTPGRVHTLATSATGVWEAALVSCVEGPVLSLGNGAFSDKWGEMSQRLGLETDVLKVEWGRPVTPDAVKAKLAQKRYAAVTAVHSETSTGVLNDLAGIAKVVRENSDALLFADCVTSLAGTKVETDAWGLDVVLTGSQKAFALPPGLALFAMSERTLAAAKKKRFRGLYLDLVDIDAFAQKKQTPTTPCLPLLYALDVQLDHILDEGVENRWARHEAMRRTVADWAAKNGFRIFAEKGAESPTVTSMIPPEGVNAEELNKVLKAAKWTTGSGYGKLKATNVRIGHMGDVDVLSVENYLKAHEQAVAGLRARATVPA
ncbi:MAG TPA: alanine--glyoxylate aminotransferase family protein [Thermoanaerobaculia bacterium]|nr:alanine--glyoxylate aminotransferase family protein [Thermoanaerobaculia bacterium]